MTLPRRSFLFGLTGLFAAPAIIRVDSLMKVVAPKPLVALDVFGNKYEAYTSWFHLEDTVVPENWRYYARIANFEPSAVFRDAPIRLTNEILRGT